MEEWRQVVGYEGLYEVSSLGRVRRVGAHGARIAAEGMVASMKERGQAAPASDL